jgi:endonuclease/exonuclease/phosphatase (EEP) superfamily protein YafD
METIFLSLSGLYLAVLFVWALLWKLSGDRLLFMPLFNLAGPLMFIPLPLVGLLAGLLRSSALGLGTLAGVGLFVLLWGRQFNPIRRRGVVSTPPGFSTTTQGGGNPPLLKVLTFNVLAYHPHLEPVIELIRAEDPDLVLVQEMNIELARCFQLDLHDRLPHQILKAIDSPAGMGMLSKHPLRPLRIDLPHEWVGAPLAAEMDWDGRPVTVVNFHLYATNHIESAGQLRHEFSLREQQAELLREYAHAHSPAILCGDGNSVALNDSSRIMNGYLTDSWEEAGFGLGHTFPTHSDAKGSMRFHIGPIPGPTRLMRIDYIYHTPELQAVSARVPQGDGASDHYPVCATLKWNSKSIIDDLS